MNDLTLFDYYTNKDLLQCIGINFLISYAINLLYKSSITDTQYVSYISSLSITTVNIVYYSNFIFTSNITNLNLINKFTTICKHYIFTFIVFFMVLYINLFTHVLIFNIELFYTDVFIKFLIVFLILYTIYFIFYFAVFFIFYKSLNTRSLFFIIYFIGLSSNLALIFSSNYKELYEILSPEFLFIYEILLNINFINIKYISLILTKIILILTSCLIFKLSFKKRV